MVSSFSKWNYTGVFLISFALFAYLRVLWLSSKLLEQGDTFAIIRVWQLPPSESFNRRVSLESRNGMWFFEPLVVFVCSMFMQLPSASSDLLMLAPSCILMPVFPVWAARSEPAKSTNENFPTLTLVLDWSFYIHVIWNTAWDLDEVSFKKVASHTLFKLPSCKSFKISSAVLTHISDIPAIHTPFTGSSRNSIFSLLGEIRSLIVSL